MQSIWLSDRALDSLFDSSESLHREDDCSVLRASICHAGHRGTPNNRTCDKKKYLAHQCKCKKVLLQIKLKICPTAKSPRLRLVQPTGWGRDWLWLHRHFYPGGSQPTSSLGRSRPERDLLDQSRGNATILNLRSWIFRPLLRRTSSDPYIWSLV
jgi:hypothetical protein